jgi:putative tricarboxylic transport membrane protein
VSSLSPRRWQDGAVGLVLLAIGTGLLIGTFNVHTLPGQDSLGPRLFPALIGGGLLVIGLALLAQVWRGKGGAAVPRDVPVETVDDLPPGHWPTLFWVIGGIAVGAAIYNFLGFILAAIAVFGLTARGFEGRFKLLHLVVAVILAVIVYVGFTRGLGLRLPAGSLFKGWF